MRDAKILCHAPSHRAITCLYPRPSLPSSSPFFSKHLIRQPGHWLLPGDQHESPSSQSGWPAALPTVTHTGGFSISTVFQGHPECDRKAATLPFQLMPTYQTNHIHKQAWAFSSSFADHIGPFSPFTALNVSWGRAPGGVMGPGSLLIS